jgi:hypothetical protein
MEPMDDKIEDQLDRAVSDLIFPPSAFLKCDPEQGNTIVRATQDKFVVNNPRAWWMALKQPFESFDYSDGFGFEDLIRHVPPDNPRCWFIPETEEQYPPVFDADVNCISAVLAQCSYFEYYLVGKNLDWLITENDHNQIIVSKISQKN